MDEHVLVPVDGSPQSRDALARAIELFPEATITLLHVVDPIDENVNDLSSDTRERYELRLEDAERVFDNVRRNVEDDDATIETAIEPGSPWRVIVSYVDDHDVDHVVMGSHGRDGAARLLLGSVAELVVRRASVPVTVVN